MHAELGGLYPATYAARTLRPMPRAAEGGVMRGHGKRNGRRLCPSYRSKPGGASRGQWSGIQLPWKPSGMRAGR